MPTREDALKILKEENASEQLIEHCEAVAKHALRLAEKIKDNGYELDLNLIETGALLHDIGRAQTNKVEHGIVGGIILRSRGLEKHARIAERHIGGGLSKEEARRLGLPAKEYMPETLEEKIITIADKLVIGEKIISIKETLKQYEDELGKNHPAIQRIKSLYEEVNSLIY